MNVGEDNSGKYLEWVIFDKTGIAHDNEHIHDFTFRMYGPYPRKVVLMNKNAVDFLLKNNTDNRFHTN